MFPPAEADPWEVRSHLATQGSPFELQGSLRGHFKGSSLSVPLASFGGLLPQFVAS